MFRKNRRKVAAVVGDPTLGITKFRDLTEDEIADRFLGLRPNPASSSRFWDGACTVCKRFPEHRKYALSEKKKFKL